MEEIIEVYVKEIVGRSVTITVKRSTTNTDFPYIAVSSLDVTGAGSTVEEAKEKCESATKLEIIMNR